MVFWFQLKGKQQKQSKPIKEEKPSEMIINIETRIVQINEKISDLKSWNVAQLNQVKHFIFSFVDDLR